MDKFSIKEYNMLIKGSLKGKLTRATDFLKIEDCSAGIKIEFYLNTSVIELSYTATRDINCSQGYGACLMKGIVYSLQDVSGRVIGKGNFVNHKLQVEERHRIFSSSDVKTVHCEIYLPSIVAIDNFFVYADNGAEFLALPKNSNKIFYIGGSNTLGSGCTFQTSTFTQIVSDNLKAETFNLGTRNQNIYNRHLLNFIKEEEPTVVVSELLAPSTEISYMKENLYDYVRDLIFTNANSIFIFWEFPYIRGCKDLVDKHEIYLSIKKKIYDSGKNNFYFLDSSKIFNQAKFDEYTISLNFMNDYANYILAEKIVEVYKILRGI